LEHRHDVLHVRARRELRHDAAVWRVQRDLARHHVADHLTALAHERGRGLVARRLDAEHDHDACRRPSVNTPNIASWITALPVGPPSTLGAMTRTSIRPFSSNDRKTMAWR